MQRHLPIGLFDSGVGGLTVLQELAELLPNEQFLYFGDTARLPYGNKSPDTIMRFAFENAAFLLEQKIKLLIIACHTACAHALTSLQAALPIPVLGVTLPGVECLLRATETNCVAVLGTTSTIQSNAIQSLLFAKRPSLEIHSIACPLFVPLVEEGLHMPSAAMLIAEHYLSHLRTTKVDRVLLACTHYPLLRPIIEPVLNPSVQLIAPAKECAANVKMYLQQSDLLNPQTNTASYCFYVSDDHVRFQHLAKLFFSRPIEKVILVQNKFL